MTAVDPLELFSVAIAIAFGDYSLFFLVFEKSFVSRYGKFNKAFDNLMLEEVSKFVTELGNKAEGKNAEKDLVQEIISTGDRFIIMRRTLDRFGVVRERAKYSLALFLLSAVLSLGTFAYSGPLNGTAAEPLTYTDVSLFALVAGVAVTAYYMFGYWTLSSLITRFELGESMAEILQEDIGK